MFGRGAARYAQLARREVFDHERQRRLEHGGAPPELDAVRPDPAALLWLSLDLVGERRAVGGEIVGKECEIREPTAVGSDVPPGMGERPAEIVERDEFQVASVGERDEGVVRSAIGVLAARRHREATAPVVGDRGLKIADDEDDMVELAKHWRMCITGPKRRSRA